MVPPLILLIGVRTTMFCGSITYALFIATFFHLTVSLLYTGSALLGIGTSMLWIAQVLPTMKTSSAQANFHWGGGGSSKPVVQMHPKTNSNLGTTIPQWILSGCLSVCQFYSRDNGSKCRNFLGHATACRDHWQHIVIPAVQRKLWYPWGCQACLYHCPCSHCQLWCPQLPGTVTSARTGSGPWTVNNHHQDYKEHLPTADHSKVPLPCCVLC